MQASLSFSKGDPLRALERIAQELGEDFGSLYCEYGSEPHDRELFSSIERTLSKRCPGSGIKAFGAFQTILDLEETIASPAYRNPKSMKDMLKLFSSNLGIGDGGFFKVQDPLPHPTQRQTAPITQDFHPKRSGEPSAFILNR